MNNNNNTLSTFERKIIWLTKGWHEEDTTEKAIISLFDKHYLWGDRVYYSVIYSRLVELVFKVCSQDQIVRFFKELFDKQHLVYGNWDAMCSGTIKMNTIIQMLFSEICNISTNKRDGTVLIDIELPEGDPMKEFINRRKIELDRANAEFRARYSNRKDDNYDNKNKIY